MFIHYFTIDNSLSPEELEEAYVRFAYKKLFQVPFPTDRYWAGRNKSISNTQKETLIHLYTDGFFVFRVLKMAFDQFEMILIHNKSYKYIPTRPLFYLQEYNGEIFYYNNSNPFRKRLKYIKNEATISEKEVDTNKLDWRLKKGFSRDYHRQHRSPNGSRKTISKRSANRANRRWENQMIQQDNFEAIDSKKDRYFYDPWDWD